MEFNIIFCSINPEFDEYYDKYLKHFDKTEYHYGCFTELENKFDCIVSPGNSFAIFDGGIDAAINRFFPEIDEFIVDMQKQLLDQCGGYQQPGTCKIFETEVKRCPYIAHAPTMAIPMIITDFSIIYHAMWSTLIEIHNHNKNNSTKKIKSVLCPALGAGAGAVRPDIVYQLIKMALEDYIEFLSNLYCPQPHPRYIITWESATNRYKKLYKYIESLDKTVEYDMYNLMTLRKLRM